MITLFFDLFLHFSSFPFPKVEIENCRLQMKAWSKVTVLCQVQSGYSFYSPS